jgi:hypothetical protein
MLVTCMVPQSLNEFEGRADSFLQCLDIALLLFMSEIALTMKWTSRCAHCGCAAWAGSVNLVNVLGDVCRLTHINDTIHRCDRRGIGAQRTSGWRAPLYAVSLWCRLCVSVE